MPRLPRRVDAPCAPMPLPRTMRPRLLVILVLLVFGFGACGVSTASPPDAGVDVAVPDTATSVDLQTPTQIASSSVGADQLAQLLTAPRPVPATTIAPGEAPPPTEPPPPPYRTGTRPDSPVIVPPPALPPGDGTVYAVGDSVLLGTQDYLGTTLGGWDLRLDARVGRAFPEGIDIIHENHASLGQAAIIVLGHNYWGGGKVYGYLDEIMAEMRSVQRVIVVTVAEWSSAQPEVNRAIRALPRTYPNVVVADWEAVVEANPQFLSPDHVHPTRSGDVALANLIAVMLGPARPNGRTVPPPKILRIPDDPTSSSPSPAGSGTTTSTPSTTAPDPVATTTTTAVAPTTTSSSTTAVPGPTTTTTAVSATTTTSHVP